MTKVEQINGQSYTLEENGVRLLDETIRLLEHRDRTIRLEDVAEKCDVSPTWLSRLLSPKPPRDPSVNAIQRVYEFLANKNLL